MPQGHVIFLSVFTPPPLGYTIIYHAGFFVSVISSRQSYTEA